MISKIRSFELLITSRVLMANALCIAFIFDTHVFKNSKKSTFNLRLNDISNLRSNDYFGVRFDIKDMPRYCVTISTFLPQCFVIQAKWS